MSGNNNNQPSTDLLITCLLFQSMNAEIPFKDIEDARRVDIFLDKKLYLLGKLI